MGNNLKKYYDIRAIPMESVSNSVVIVDGSLWLNQSLSVYRAADGEYFTNSKGVVTSHLYGVLSKIVPLICKGNTVIFCIDGVRLDAKMNTIAKRMKQHERQATLLENLRKSVLITREEILRAAKRVIKVTDSMITTLSRMLRLLGVTMIRSKNEAESQCVFIQKSLKSKGINSYIFSADSDTIVFGGENVILSQTTDEYLIGSSSLTLQKLELTLSQLIDIVLLSGGDYSEGVFGVGPVQSIKLIRKYQSLKSIPDSEFSLAKSDSWQKVRSEYDTLFPLYYNPPVNVDFKIDEPIIDFEELELYLVEELDFSRRLLITLADHYLRLHGVAEA